jgi:hypothetical protein
LVASLANARCDAIGPAKWRTLMPDARQKLIGLLDYVEQVVRLDERVAFRLSE